MQKTIDTEQISSRINENDEEWTIDKTNYIERLPIKSNEKETKKQMRDIEITNSK